MKNTLACALSILAISTATSTTTAQDRTVALTSTTQFLVGQTMDGKTCRSVRCGLSFEKALAPNAGGTAYDARSSFVWISNGLALAAYRAPGPTVACRQACKISKIPQPIAGVRSYCTGLAYLDAGAKTSTGGLGPYGRLYCLYSSNVIGVADVKGCTVFNWKFCKITNVIGTANITGGLACDDLRRQLFVGTYTTLGGAMCYVFDADKVCAPLCKFPLTVNKLACGKTTTPLKGMRGLAFNGCTKFLYATDGLQTIFGLYAMSPTGACNFYHRACCKVATEAYTGLALLPPPQSKLGKPCAARVCNTCTPSISTTGDAVLGNALFRINLQNGPSNTSAYALAIGIGACSTPGINLGFCQPALVSVSPPGPFVFLFSAVPSLAGCSRNASVPLPLGVNAAGCGLKLSFQWVMACKGKPTGSAMTDCLTVQLSSL